MGSERPFRGIGRLGKAGLVLVGASFALKIAHKAVGGGNGAVYLALAGFAAAAGLLVADRVRYHRARKASAAT